MRCPGPSPQNPSSSVSSASRLPGLRGHLRGKVGGALLHALAQHVAREAAHLRSIGLRIKQWDDAHALAQDVAREAPHTLLHGMQKFFGNVT